MDKKGLKHIFDHHHPKYWGGKSKDLQSFIANKETIESVIEKIQVIMKQNRNTLLKKGTNGRFTIAGVIDGITYQLGFKYGSIGQFYPKL